MRYTRAVLGDLASSGYIDMARSCGMTRTQAVLRVGLRLATPQLVSVIGLTFASMVTGVMVIENLFALPGIGPSICPLDLQVFKSQRQAGATHKRDRPQKS